MAPDKSLAAEIESIIDRAKGYDTPRPDDPRRRYTQAQMEIAVRTALQSRAFEDGARWMRERAFDVARAWQMPAAPATADETLIARVQARNETVAGIAAGIMALHPEGERTA